MSVLRPAWAEIDLGALKHNVGLVRRRVGPRVKIFAVVKSHGFGCGAGPAGRAAIDGGADALAVGDPEDVRDIRNDGNDVPVLLYASTPPDVAGEVAALGAIVTIHDLESLRAFAALDRPVEAFVKVEAGLGRLGVPPEGWGTVFETARRSDTLRLTGIYTHLNAPDDPDEIAQQIARYDEACRQAEAMGLEGLTRMVASSLVTLGYPGLRYDAVNPGRFLFGLVEGRWAEIDAARPVIAAVKSRVIQVKEFAANEVVGFLGSKPFATGDPARGAAARVRRWPQPFAPVGEAPGGRRASSNHCTPRHRTCRDRCHRHPGSAGRERSRAAGPAGSRRDHGGGARRLVESAGARTASPLGPYPAPGISRLILGRARLQTKPVSHPLAGRHRAISDTSRTRPQDQLGS